MQHATGGPLGGDPGISNATGESSEILGRNLIAFAGYYLTRKRLLNRTLFLMNDCKGLWAASDTGWNNIWLHKKIAEELKASFSFGFGRVSTIKIILKVFGKIYLQL